MDFEIHLYMAVARSVTAHAYLPDEHHPMLVFLRQPPGSAHDFDAAEQVILRGGWSEVDFTKAGILPPDAGERKDEPYASCYAAAVEDGDSLMVYDTVVQPAPKKKG
jgi:hypothetical protein